MLKLTGLLLITLLVLPVAAAERRTLEVIGLTARGEVIERITVAAPKADRTVILIGGLSGPDGSVEQVRRAIHDFKKLKAANRPFRLLAIPLANPDGVPLEFPPTGIAYRENIEANTL